MSSTVPEIMPLPTVADETLEQAASRLHVLVDEFLVNARSRKQDNESFHVNATSSKIKIDPKEIPLRETLAETCRRVAALAVDPIEELSTIAYQGPLLAALKTICDLGIPNLVPLGTDIAIDELAEKAHVDSDFLERLLRVLIASYIFAITAPRRIMHTTFSAPLRDRDIESLMLLATKPGLHSSAFAAEVWRDQGYQKPQDSRALAFQKAHGTDLHFFDYLNTHDTELGKRFDSAMAGWGTFTMELTLDTFPFNEALRRQGTTIVDVGGGRGHMMKKIRARWPNVEARIIVQDQPSVLEGIENEEVGFEFQRHSFFDPQPVKGADYYFFRRIFHDWPDKDCILILQRTRDAMTPGKGRILIADFVMPELESPRFRSTSHIMMGMLIGGAERTEQQWRRLIASADDRFCLEKIWTHPANKEFVLEISFN